MANNNAMAPANANQAIAQPPQQDAKMVRKEKKMTFGMAITSKGYQKLINDTLQDPKKAQRFTAALTSAVAVNPTLSLCTPASILSAALLGESLGLSPSPQLGQYYMVPFDVAVKDENGRPVYARDPETGEYLYETNQRTGKSYKIQVKEKKAQFQLGYKGYIQLALRSGYYKRLNVMSIKAGELIRYDPLTEEIDVHLMEDELARERAQSIGYVAMFEYHNGFKKVLYWSRQKMEAHALRYSKGYAAKSGYTFWEKDFDAMAYKTMLRQLISKWGIMSIDLQTAFEQDTVVEDQNDNGYIDMAAPSLEPATDMPQLPDEPDEEETPVIDENDAAPKAPAGPDGDPADDLPFEMGLDDL